MRRARNLTIAACAGALATTLLAAAPASAHTSADHAGRHASSRDHGRTTVVLNPDLVPVLVKTLKVRAIAPGTLSAPRGVAQASFPITGVEPKVIEHAGGLRFTPVGGGSLRITHFNVDLGTGYLNAKTTLNGKRLPGRVDIFRLGPVRPIKGRVPSCDGTAAGLTLTKAAAAALGAPKFAGAFVGDACVVPHKRHHHDED